MFGQLGISLIEILIGLLVISLGLLGLESAEIIAQRNQHAAYFFSQADSALVSITECLRATKSAKYCKQFFSEQVTEQLPNGVLNVRLSNGEYQIIVGWKENRIQPSTTVCSRYFASDFMCLVATGKIGV